MDTTPPLADARLLLLAACFIPSAIKRRRRGTTDPCRPQQKMGRRPRSAVRDPPRRFVLTIGTADRGPQTTAGCSGGPVRNIAGQAGRFSETSSADRVARKSARPLVSFVGEARPWPAV